MKKRLYLILGIIMILIIAIVGCANKSALPEGLNVEESIKEIILSKGEGYDFMQDESFVKHIDVLSKILVPEEYEDSIHYALGHLDEDNIPEIAIYMERNHNNMEDAGTLAIFKFNGEKYISVDSISMNYDNSNLQMEIGKLSETQNGLLINNLVGAHSSFIHGFILEDGKIKTVLNEKKINLISVYPDNEIKDIDNDGILEFSILMIDPENDKESSVDADKMTLWYKWDGKDGGNLIQFKRIDYTDLPSNDEIYQEAESLIEEDLLESLFFIKENKEELSKYHLTELLKEYINILEEESHSRSMEIGDLFVKYQEGYNFDHLLSKYQLSMDRLNDLDFLNRERTFQSEIDLKTHLINHINMGYKLYSSEGMYYYIIDHQGFIDEFGQNLMVEFRDYLKLLALETNEPYMIDGALVISKEKLASRIVLFEDYRMIYPYSNFLDNLNERYKYYIYAYLYGDNHDPNFNSQFKMKEEAFSDFHDAMENYPDSYFSDILDDFIKLLNQNQKILNDDIRNFIDEQLF